MDSDLFFIPMIAEALDNPYINVSLRRSFERIVTTAGDRRYQYGWENFQSFMALAQNNAVEHKAAAAPTGFEGVLDRVAPVRLILQRDGRYVGAADVKPPNASPRLFGLLPGHYMLTTDTGWVLWERQLTEEDLLWYHARSPNWLPLAAETGAPEVRPRQTIKLAECGLLLGIYAGLEAGSIEITSISWDAKA